MQWMTSMPMESVKESNFQARHTVTNIKPAEDIFQLFLTMPCVKWKQLFGYLFLFLNEPKSTLWQEPFGWSILSINYLPRHKACNDRKLLDWPRLFLDSEPHASTDLSCELKEIKRITPLTVWPQKKSVMCACRELLDRWRQQSPKPGMETWWNMTIHDKTKVTKKVVIFCDFKHWQWSLCLGTFSFSSLSSLHVMLSTLPLPDPFWCAEMTKATFIPIPASSFAVVQTWFALALVVKLPLDKTRERNLLGTWSTMFGDLLTLLHRILCCSSLNLK